jgi:hypothetical protein
MLATDSVRTHNTFLGYIISRKPQQPCGAIAFTYRHTDFTLVLKNTGSLISNHGGLPNTSIIYRVFKKEWCGFKNFLNDYILQLDGAPHHFHRNVRELLNRILQQHWIGRVANGDNHIHIPYGTNSIIVWMCRVTQGAYIEGL